MLISRDTLPEPDALFIRSYGEDFVRVRDREVRTSFLLTPAVLDQDWPPASVAELRIEHLDALLAHEPEIILLGTGTRLRHPGMELIGHVMRRGVGFEVMDTPSACRTYNILMSESRRVVAAFLFD